MSHEIQKLIRLVDMRNRAMVNKEKQNSEALSWAITLIGEKLGVNVSDVVRRR